MIRRAFAWGYWNRKGVGLGIGGGVILSACIGIRLIALTLFIGVLTSGLEFLGAIPATRAGLFLSASVAASSGLGHITINFGVVYRLTNIFFAVLANGLVLIIIDAHELCIGVLALLYGRTSVTASAAALLGSSTAMICLAGALNSLGLATASITTGLLNGLGFGILLSIICPTVIESLHVLNLGLAALTQGGFLAILLTGGGVGLFGKAVCGVAILGITANGALMPMFVLTVAPATAGLVCNGALVNGLDLHVRSITVLAAVGFIAIGRTSGFNSFGGVIRSFMIGLIHIFGFAQTAGALKNINTEGGAGSCC